ncbi:DUF3429 domain-containing protein [Azospirillum sp. sgz302134]
MPIPESDRRTANAKLLSYLGLIPFVGGAALAWATGGELRAAALQAVIVYAVAILSFIGAIHWGRVLAGQEGEDIGPAWLGWGITPSLLGWFATLLPQGLTVLVLILSFTAAWAADRRSVGEGRYPDWFGTLRTRLIVIVGLTLATLIPLAA